MPQTTVRLFREGLQVPVLDWLKQLKRSDPKAYAKCLVRMERLAEQGHELRRPEADFLRDGIYELRVRKGHVNYRILYFFHGSQVALLAHGLTKEAEVPSADIDRALQRKRAYEQDPEGHAYEVNPTEM